MRVNESVGDCSRHCEYDAFDNFPAARLVFEIQDGLNLERAICIMA